MGLTWHCHGFHGASMGLDGGFNSILMGLPLRCDFHGTSMRVPWNFNGTPAGLSWDFYEIAM